MAAKAKSTDSTSNTTGRFVVQLPEDVGRELTELGEHMQQEMAKQLGFAPELSRGQIVQALVKGALAQRAERARAEAGQANGTPAGA